MKSGLFALVFLTSGVAHAACEKQVAALETAEGEGVVAAYQAVAACDGGAAAMSFSTAQKKTTDAEALGELAKAAIGAGADETVHQMLDPIADYSAQQAVAGAVGARCDDPKVLAWVRALHTTLRGRAFQSWSPAIEACAADELTADLERLAAEPPDKTFDDKYGKVVELYAKRKGAGALPGLQKAAIAAENGPFTVVLDAMVKTVTPEGLGAKPTGADLEALVTALQAVANQVGPEAAARVADKLVNLGQEDAAAALLPRLHPGKAQSGGGFLYGMAAVEACDTDAVVHWAVVEDTKGQWSIQGPLEDKASSLFKSKVKCDAPTWTVFVSPTPVTDDKEAEAWAETVPETAGVGDAKLREEKTITL